MPAALFMARTVVIVQMAARLISTAGGGAPEPVAILSEVNRALCENNPSRMFVTLFLAILDPRTGVLRYGNAGHTSPYVRSPDGTVTALEGIRGAPLGINPTLVYRGGVTQLCEGDMLFAYSDGITEAADPGDRMFGAARLERVLREAKDHDAAALTGAVLGAVRRFAGDAIQSDDITMLAVRLRPVTKFGSPG